MANGKRIPLTPALIAKQLHEVDVLYFAEAGKILSPEQNAALRPSRQHVRRALEDLDNDGLAERRTNTGALLRDLSIEELQRLPTGRVRLRFFTRPVRPRKLREETVPDDSIRFSGMSPEDCRLLAKVLKRQGITLPREVVANSYITEQASVAVAEYVRAQKVAEKAVMERLLVAINRERIEIRTSEIKDRNNNNRERGSGTPVVVVVSGAPVPTDADINIVYAEFPPYGTITRKATAEFVMACRNAKPDCTPEQIIGAMRAVANGFNRGTQNPIGVLRKVVPQKLLDPPDPKPETDEQRRFREYRHVLEHPDQYDAETVKYAHEWLASRQPPSDS